MILKTAFLVFIPCLVLTLPTWCQAENLLRNSDFSAGKANWRGDGSVHRYESGDDGEFERVLEVALRSNREREFHQNFRVGSSTRAVSLRFRVKGNDDFETDMPTGAITVWFELPRGATPIPTAR